MARSNAITSGSNVTICPSIDEENCSENGWGGGWIVFNDTDGDSVPDAGEVLRVIALEGNLTDAGYGDAIVFQADGTTSLDADATITGCHGDASDPGGCFDVTVELLLRMIQSHRHQSSGCVWGKHFNPRCNRPMTLLRIQNGFTLIEVLTAVAILGVGLISIAGLALANLKNTAYGQSRVTGNYYCRGIGRHHAGQSLPPTKIVCLPGIWIPERKSALARPLAILPNRHNTMPPPGYSTQQPLCREASP